jgi:small subunit ribosomal protein S17
MASKVEKDISVKPCQSRALEGVVVSDSMDKTIVVLVARTYKHSLLGKIVRSVKKYKAHDEKNTAKCGDTVEIVESRPLSKTKHMVLSRVLRTEN